jgi:hypothetical protein
VLAFKIFIVAKNGAGATVRHSVGNPEVDEARASWGFPRLVNSKT